MSKSKNAAVEPTAELTENAPDRSPARAALAARIEARERAHAVIGEKQAAARRLAEFGTKAKEAADRLAAAKALDAQIVAHHVLSGGTGGPPRLTDEARADLHARAAEAAAQAEAAIPAAAVIEAEITSALAAHHQAAAAVNPAALPVVEEEIAVAVADVRAAMAKLMPVVERLAGARAFAHHWAWSGDEAERSAFRTIANGIDETMMGLRLDPRTPANGADAAWGALMQRLAIDADAVA